jgi:hypothetical protein
MFLNADPEDVLSSVIVLNSAGDCFGAIEDGTIEILWYELYLLIQTSGFYLTVLKGQRATRWLRMSLGIYHLKHL